MITFVTGIYGAGKTTHAMSLTGIDGRYVSYDQSHDYGNPDHDPVPFLAGLEAGDVVDAIPFRAPARGRHRWEEFLSWSSGRSDVQVFVCALPQHVWEKRMGQRVDNVAWCRFWVDAFGLLSEASYLYNAKMRPVSRADAARKMDLAGLLRKYLEVPFDGHDAKYQDIPSIGFVGYSQSSRTWETIAGLVPWEGARVVDVGANHGYFTVKAQEAGATATGLERHYSALAVAGCHGLLSGSGAMFRHWSAGDPMPEADVLLCLNAIHHFGDSTEAFLDSASPPLAIYEAGEEWGDRLRQRYARVEEFPSHRHRRAVFRCYR